MTVTSREIALQMIRLLELDNGCKFKFTNNQLSVLTGGVQKMLDAGCDFQYASSDLESPLYVIVCGDQDEAQEQFSKYAGWEIVTETLGKIFDAA